jgi:hypothetical protein
MMTKQGTYWVLFGLFLATVNVAKAAGDPTGISGIGTAAVNAAQAEAAAAATKKIQSITGTATDQLGTATEAAESELSDAKAITDTDLKKKGPKKGNIRQMTGRVTAIDATANSFTVQKGKKETVIHTTEKTQVKVGKTVKSLSDLKVGDKVKMRLSEDAGQLVARVIHLKP